MVVAGHIEYNQIGFCTIDLSDVRAAFQPLDVGSITNEGAMQMQVTMKLI